MGTTDDSHNNQADNSLSIREGMEANVQLGCFVRIQPKHLAREPHEPCAYEVTVIRNGPDIYPGVRPTEEAMCSTTTSEREIPWGYNGFYARLDGDGDSGNDDGDSDSDSDDGYDDSDFETYRERIRCAFELNFGSDASPIVRTTRSGEELKTGFCHMTDAFFHRNEVVEHAGRLVAPLHFAVTPDMIKKLEDFLTTYGASNRITIDFGPVNDRKHMDEWLAPDSQGRIFVFLSMTSLRPVLNTLGRYVMRQNVSYMDDYHNTIVAALERESYIRSCGGYTEFLVDAILSCCPATTTIVCLRSHAIDIIAVFMTLLQARAKQYIDFRNVKKGQTNNPPKVTWPTSIKVTDQRKSTWKDIRAMHIGDTSVYFFAPYSACDDVIVHSLSTLKIAWE